MKTGPIIGIVVVLALLLGSCEFVSTRNNLAREKEAISGQWSQVDADLQRRADLVPNLVETVKGYAKEETSVVQEVANARAALGGAQTPQQKIDANTRLDGALGRLLVVVENYPNLKANENFQQLQMELTDLENKIAASRRFFNNAVQEYNTGIQRFPAMLFAGMLGFTEKQFFDLGSDRQAVSEAPQVKF